MFAHYAKIKKFLNFLALVQIWPNISPNLTSLTCVYVCLGSLCDHLFSLSRDGRFGSKLGKIGPKWDKSGAFSDQISVHLAHRICPNLGPI